MDPIQRSNSQPVPNSESGSGPEPQVYTLRKGDTLSGIALRLKADGFPGTRDDIVRLLLSLNPEIKDPNVVRAGAPLKLPQALSAQGESSNSVTRFSAPTLPPPSVAQANTADVTSRAGWMAQLQGAFAPTAKFLRTDGTAFPTSADGTPLYRQADAAWGGRRLGNGTNPTTVGGAGCAMTAVAMALSKISGETLTPAKLDAHLDATGGYAGHALYWDKAGSAVQSRVSVVKDAKCNLSKIDAELDAGRPVVLGVDYKANKSSGGSLGTDHWLCLTRRTEDGRYFANDPATGSEVSFVLDAKGVLVQERPPTAKGSPYRSSGEFATFSPTKPNLERPLGRVS